VSRALRRHPVGGQPSQKRPSRPPTIRTGSSRPVRAAKEGRGLIGLLRPRWAEEIISELRKVTWPSRQETLNLTWVVILVAGAVGVFLGGVDMFFNWVIQNTLF